VAAVVNVSPASITNGAPTAVSSNDPVADFGTILSAFAAANLGVAGAVLVMNESNALAMGMLRDASGNRVFPSVSATGGTAEGITIIASNTAGSNVVGMIPRYILVADEGGVEIDVSREATVQMDSAPVPPDATTVLTSLWQNNLIGMRAERFINWKRGLDPAVYYLTAANYQVGGAAAAA
jgi:hypothetical protein